jgi:putative transposase
MCILFFILSSLGIKECLKVVFVEIGKWYPEFEYKEVNIQEDHIHLVISFPPKYSIAQVVQIIKQNTSKTLKDKFDFLKTIYKGGSIWSVGYFVATVGLDEEMILNYLYNQFD